MARRAPEEPEAEGPSVHDVDMLPGDRPALHQSYPSGRLA